MHYITQKLGKLLPSEVNEHDSFVFYLFIYRNQIYNHQQVKNSEEIIFYLINKCNWSAIMLD